VFDNSLQQKGFYYVQSESKLKTKQYVLFTKCQMFAFLTIKLKEIALFLVQNAVILHS